MSDPFWRRLQEGRLTIEERRVIRALTEKLPAPMAEWPLDPALCPSGRRVPRILYGDTLEILRR